MPRKLKDEVERTTGITLGGKPVSVILKATDDGGELHFRRGTKTKKIPLQQILTNVMSDKPSTGEMVDTDWVNLGELESRIMISATMPAGVKSGLWQIIRNMRDERREEQGKPPVIWRGEQKINSTIKRKKK